MIDQSELINIISKSLNLSKDKVDISVSSESLEEWDSLGHLAVFFSIDKETKGKASKIKKLAESKNIKQIFDQLKKQKLAN